jgi:hypothetical protein
MTLSFSDKIMFFIKYLSLTAEAIAQWQILIAFDM